MPPYLCPHVATRVFSANVDDRTPPPTFRAAAIASGLLTQEQVGEAEAGVRADQGNVDTKTRIAEAELIAKVLELGWLNRWQVEQLKLGRTRFKLGDYLVIDSIGRGGMGQVFKAVHGMMGRVEAIKVLPRDKATPTAIASFTREIRAQAQMDHPNLVRALSAGRDGNVYYLVTEYVPGTDLRKFVRARQKLTMQEAATVISQAAEGLGYAHHRGMVHRDVKPGNLLVTPDGHTKVSDLGLAGFLGDADPDDPRTGKVVGTADYLAPELIQNPRAISSSADIYSLGCTLYYAVTGKVPFPGGTTREKAIRHVEDIPIRPSRINPDLSEEFVDVIGAMMERDPAKRLQTMTEVIERLAPWARDAVANAVDDAARGAVPPDFNGTPSDLSDADSGFLFGEDAAEGMSQLSQGTDPLASASEETIPDPLRRRRRKDPVRVPTRIVLIALGPIVAIALTLFASLLLKALW
jgi:serine/threonine protein kinase